MPEQPWKPTMETNIAELRVYIREKPTDEACCAGGGIRGGGTKGWPGRWASSCRYYNVNASVNTPRDVFRKAWISRRLLILVIADTCTWDALNVGLREEERLKTDGWERERGRWNSTPQAEIFNDRDVKLRLIMLLKLWFAYFLLFVIIVFNIFIIRCKIYLNRKVYFLIYGCSIFYSRLLIYLWGKTTIFSIKLFMEKNCYNFLLFNERNILF